jgi:general stress protein CsbA
LHTAVFGTSALVLAGASASHQKAFVFQTLIHINIDAAPLILGKLVFKKIAAHLNHKFCNFHVPSTLAS